MCRLWQPSFKKNSLFWTKTSDDEKRNTARGVAPGTATRQEPRPPRICRLSLHRSICGTASYASPTRFAHVGAKAGHPYSGVRH